MTGARHPRCTTPGGAVRVADHVKGAPGDVCVAEKEQDVVLGLRRLGSQMNPGPLPAPSLANATLPRQLFNLPETHTPHFEQCLAHRVLVRIE